MNKEKDKGREAEKDKPGAGKPPAAPEALPQYASCPYCTLQVKVGDATCPHCRQALAAPAAGPAKKAKPSAPGARRAAGRARGGSFLERYWKWIAAAVPVVLALVVVVVIYERWVGVRITVVPNPSLPVKATLEKKGSLVLLRGTMLNEGEDVPDLSLKSIGVMVEFAYRNGRRQKKRVFPKAEFRGEGALLRGETGSFEIEAPKEGLEEIVLRAEIVDLGAGRDLTPAGGKWRVVPNGK